MGRNTRPVQPVTGDHDGQTAEGPQIEGALRTDHEALTEMRELLATGEHGDSITRTITLTGIEVEVLLRVLDGRRTLVQARTTDGYLDGWVVASDDLAPTRLARIIGDVTETLVEDRFIRFDG